MTNKQPLLYTFRRCPYAIRARLAIKVSTIFVNEIEVTLRDKPQALLALSPKATVPVLQLCDGTVIDESLDIMHWALGQHDPDGWLKCDDER
ncbi:MAG: glutathione S-transferase, partial [Gammaproteobacteria bacterium]|nr:glutathione S-transferase [Gammaproteobacteria bacterium]